MSDSRNFGDIPLWTEEGYIAVPHSHRVVNNKVTELRNKICDEAIKWADEVTLEFSKDERPPAAQSTFENRRSQRVSLSLIREFVEELHKLER